MISRTLLDRIARIEQRVAPDESLKTEVHFVELVDGDDPRCGSWTSWTQETRGTAFPVTAFFGRDLAHIEELEGEYRQQQLNGPRHFGHQEV